MWSLLRTRRWISFTLLVIVAIAAFGLLSRWQWQRAEERRIDRIAWDSQAAEAPVGLDAIIAGPREWQPVRVSGTYDDDATVLVRQRPLDGRNGFWVATPLVTDAGRVWVNRGWIPVQAAATGVVTAPDAPSGTVVIEARTRLAERTEVPTPTDLPDGQVPALDPGALGADVTTVYLEATASEPTDPSVTRIPAPVIDETRNVSYAVQWLLFAAVAIAGWWFFLRREAREDAAASDATEPDREEAAP